MAEPKTFKELTNLCQMVQEFRWGKLWMTKLTRSSGSFYFTPLDGKTFGHGKTWVKVGSIKEGFVRIGVSDRPLRRAILDCCDCVGVRELPKH